MNEQKTPKGVVLYYSFYPDIFSKLDDHQRSLILEAIFSTGGVCPMPELDEMTDLIWGLLSRILEINGERYQQAVQAGKKGAQKRAENLEAKRQKKIEEASAESLSFDQQAEANEQALSFDEQAYKIKEDKIKEHDIKEDKKITNAHRLTPITGAWQRPAQLPLRLCVRSCRARCAAFLAKSGKPKHP